MRVTDWRIGSYPRQFYFELNYPAKMPSPDKVDPEGTDKPTNSESKALDRHGEYYFSFIIFLVSDIDDDSDQAD